MIHNKARNELVKKYLREYEHLPTLTLAKLIYKENAAHFKNIEFARRMLRYYRGANGKKDLVKLGSGEFIKPPGDYNPFDDIPEGLKHFEEWKPHRIQGEKILKLADVHVPYHDKEAVMAALKWGQDEKIDTVVIDDWIDFFSISFWEKDPNKRNLNNEIETSKKMLGVIRDIFPDAEIIWNKGNHEARYDRYMRVKAPELIGVKHFEFGAVMGADAMGVKVIEDKMFCAVGRLNIVHGHEFGRSIFSPVNPARGLYLRAKTNCIASHWHQTSSHTEKDMNDDVIGCWTTGCLCDMRPDYAPINKWNHGTAIIYRTGTKSFRVINKTIIDGELY